MTAGPARAVASWTATAGDATVVVDAVHGCRVASLVVRGRELLVTNARRGPLEWGCYPMVPFAGRVRHGRFTFDGETYELPTNLPPHAIHGTVFDVEWAEIDATATTSMWTAPLGPTWPFPGRVVQWVRLEPDALSMRLEVHVEDGRMPASCGWHPWWRRPVAATIDAVAMYRRDEQGVPDGRMTGPPVPRVRMRRLDDCFTGLRAPPELRFDAGAGPVVTVGTDCPCVVVFNERRDAVCVEPQTHPPNALEIGPAVVEPGNPLIANVDFLWDVAPAS